MNSKDSVSPSTDRILALIHGELSSGRRWTYRLILLATSISVAAIVSLWSTEPGPLPLRLHIAFAALTCIGSGWICVLTWILMRRNCPTALDRLATAWMATIACSLFLVMSLPIALMRSGPQVTVCLGALGIVLLGAALFMLRGAYRLRTQLRAKRAQLEMLSR